MAGISINLVLGENGIITKAKEAKQANEIAEGKEKIVIAISSMLIEYVEQQKTMSIEDIENLGNYEKDIVSVDINQTPAQVNYKGKYIYEISNKFEVNYLGESSGVIISVNIPKSTVWVKSLSEGKEVTGKISSNKKIKSTSIIKDDNKTELILDENGNFKYTLTQNGKYTIEVVDNDSEIWNKEITIDLQEDNVSPIIEEKLSVKTLETGIVLNLKAIDEKSGIEKIVWNYSLEDNKEYIKETTGDIQNITIENQTEVYNIYAKIYDFVGNYVKTEILNPSYVKSGLILYLDGINKNISNNTWNDLSINNNDATLYNCTIEDDCITFNGSSSYALLPEDAFGSYGESTIEIVLKVNNDCVVIADNSNISYRGLCFKGNQICPALCTNSARKAFSTSSVFSNKNLYTLLYDGSSYSDTECYVNTVLATENGTQGFSNNSSNVVMGRRYWATGTAKYMNGSIYAIRVYDRKLTNEEILQNYELDKERFSLE